MLKHRKWVVVLMLLFLIGSTDAADKGKPYPDGKGNGETLSVEYVDILKWNRTFGCQAEQSIVVKLADIQRQ